MTSQEWKGKPFGETLVDEHTNSFNSPFKYNGKEIDEETGNYYYGARYYDPKWNMFISVDPLVEKTMDAYGYCYNNPINLVDVDGQQGTPVYDNIITTVSNKRGDSHYVTRTVQITMTLSVVNEKGANLSNTIFSKSSGSVTLSPLSGLAQKDFRGNDVYAQDNVNVKIQYKVVSSLKDVGKDDHVMVLSGDIPKVFGEKGSPVGRAELGGRVSAVERGTLKNGTFDEVVSHEIGHMLDYNTKKGG